MKNSRCSECKEPEFMCECAKNFKGEIITEVYHRGVFVGGEQNRLHRFFLSVKATIIIGGKAFCLVSPDRHFGNRIFEGVR